MEKQKEGEKRHQIYSQRVVVEGERWSQHRLLEESIHL